MAVIACAASGIPDEQRFPVLSELDRRGAQHRQQLSGTRQAALLEHEGRCTIVPNPRLEPQQEPYQVTARLAGLHKPGEKIILASDASSYVTSSTLVIDERYTAW